MQGVVWQTETVYVRMNRDVVCAVAFLTPSPTASSKSCNSSVGGETTTSCGPRANALVGRRAEKAFTPCFLFTSTFTVLLVVPGWTRKKTGSSTKTILGHNYARGEIN